MSVNQVDWTKVTYLLDFCLSGHRFYFPVGLCSNCHCLFLWGDFYSIILGLWGNGILLFFFWKSFNGHSLCLVFLLLRSDENLIWMTYVKINLNFFLLRPRARVFALILYFLTLNLCCFFFSLIKLSLSLTYNIFLRLFFALFEYYFEILTSLFGTIFRHRRWGHIEMLFHFLLRLALKLLL